MRRLSLQWRITLMTALLVCVMCVLMNCLIGYSGMRYMDSIGSGISACGDIGDGAAASFDPDNRELDEELTIVVSNAQESFSTTNWLITIAVTLLGGVLAYFVSGRALRPLRAFASQVENVQPNNLADMKISEDVLPEFKRFSKSFNSMIDRLDEGFSAQRQFTGNAAHELRTPLTNIKSYAETIVDTGDELPPELRSNFMNVIISEADRMTRIVQDLLTLSKIDYGKMEMNISRFPFLKAVQNVYDAAKLNAEQNHHHTMTLTCEGEIPDVNGDRERIEQVITNIVSNAVKYTPDGGKIDMLVGTSGKNVFVRVTDNGIGIPEKDLPRLFDRFYRVDKARSRESGGTGLGLSIAQEILNQHKGRIEISSEYGKGTSVLITMPAAEAQA